MLINLREFSGRTIFISVALIALVLSGCGGGSSGGGSSGDGSAGGDTDGGTAVSSNPQPTGVFVDAPVAGLNYTQGDITGVTDEFGAFVYDPDGGPITFSVGPIQIGQAAPDGRITPEDLSVDAVPVNPVNVARFLQSLDEDRDPNNGIDVSAAAEFLGSASFLALDFTLSPNDFDSILDSFWVQGGFANEGFGDNPVPREEADSALTEGTITRFQDSDVANSIFFYQVAGTDGVQDSGLIAFEGDRGIINPMSDFQEHGGTGVGESDGDREFTWSIEDGEVVLTLRRGGEARLTRVSASTLNGIRRFSVIYSEQGFRSDDDRVLVHLTRGRVPATPSRYFLRGLTGERFLVYPMGNVEVPWAVDQPDIGIDVCAQGKAGRTPDLSWHGGDAITEVRWNIRALRQIRFDETQEPFSPGQYMMQFGGLTGGYNILFVETFDGSDTDGWPGWITYFWARAEATTATSCP
ncbi:MULTISPECIES: hypothetical protein [unclassified Thioalkalivibrio]|uniref:hypothetical protein n=1 Tax=unclassified Thioalkalivibrio TaxID=2621013 RepID=UPI00039E586C|nr:MULTISPECIES: hypothetical protein [unclassified Thioalkalivibrio]